MHLHRTHRGSIRDGEDSVWQIRKLFDNFQRTTVGIKHDSNFTDGPQSVQIAGHTFGVASAQKALISCSCAERRREEIQEDSLAVTQARFDYQCA
jgi:hypothetical protein